MVKIGMLLFEGMTQLDLTGPLEIFSRFPETKIYLISKTLDPVRSDRVLTILPDTTFSNCPENLTVFFVPGGPGVSNVLTDREYLKFIRARRDSTYISSVCTGSLILAACGLLAGFKATTHWLSIELLKCFDVETRHERVVNDGSRITGGGVTSGIDFALVIASILFGEDVAREIQLLIEYNPQPPFNSGHPNVADTHLVRRVTEQRAAMQQRGWKKFKSFLPPKKFGGKS